MEVEVFPHIPDAMYFYEFDPTKAESATNKENLEQSSRLHVISMNIKNRNVPMLFWLDSWPTRRLFLQELQPCRKRNKDGKNETKWYSMDW